MTTARGPRRRVRRWAVVALAVALPAASAARAQVNVRVFEGAGTPPTVAVKPTARLLSGDAPLPALVELPPGVAPAAFGLVEVAPGFSALRAPLAKLVELSRAHPDFRVTWSPPFVPMLDRAAGLCRTTQYRAATGRTGKGVFVGVVDTGIDVFHPDFRNANGTTRIAYFVDFSRGARGTDPDAEAQCPTSLPCGVFTRGDIDAALVANDRAMFPADTGGHGTHVASLAAGNGGPAGRYVGQAPEADLVVIRALDKDGNLSDAAIQTGTALVFWLAERDGRQRGLDRIPAAVNLSLGSDFGPHDGSSPIDRALGALVGPDRPGRAIVVAAGNGAGMYRLASGYPDPRGIHTVVNVTEGTRVRVPVVTDTLLSPTTALKAAWFAWIDFRPGDDLRVGLERHDSTWVEPQARGAVGQFAADAGALLATVVNGATSALGSQFSDANGAAVGIEGTWGSTETFAITLEGRGTASLWVQSYGDLGPDSGNAGALFPGATKEGTIAIPGEARDLVAVGATVNRTDWVDRQGDAITVPQLGPLVNPRIDSVTFFSGAGPTTDGRLKPDLVAPGGFVAGAMSADADPRTSATSIFAGSPFCLPHDECAVIDDRHAVTLGTSMAAPLVSGAIALLFEGDPLLTSDRILGRLQAGAHYPTGTVSLPPQLGAGALDLEGALDQERLETAPEMRSISPRSSWLTLGAETARPDPESLVPALLQLRDGQGHAAAGARAGDLQIDVRRGRVAVAPVLEAPGLVAFSVAASSGTGGDTLEVTVSEGGTEIATESLPIAVDVNVAREGFFARGGCSVRRTSTEPPWLTALALGALTLLGGSRRRSAVRTARSPGRTGTRGRGRRGSSRR